MTRKLINYTLLLFSFIWCPIALGASPNLSAYKDLDGLNKSVLKLGLQAYECQLAQHVVKNPMLTIVNFDLPSNKKRLWVIDPVNHKLLFKLLVAHGSGSGELFADDFSNKVNSHESSLGIYLTENSYFGKHGYSMRLKGLEKGVNNNALKRDIVMHSAWYVNENFVHKYDRLGRSWGCFAINQKDVKEVIDAIKGGSILFAYADREKDDPFLTHCPVHLKKWYSGSELEDRHSMF